MLLTLTNPIIQLQNQYNQSMFKMIMDMNLISVSVSEHDYLNRETERIK